MRKVTAIAVALMILATPIVAQNDQITGNEPGCAQLAWQLQYPAAGPCWEDGFVMAPWGECVTPAQLQNTLMGMRALCGADAKIDEWIALMTGYIAVFWTLCISNPGLCYQIFTR